MINPLGSREATTHPVPWSRAASAAPSVCSFHQQTEFGMGLDAKASVQLREKSSEQVPKPGSGKGKRGGGASVLAGHALRRGFWAQSQVVPPHHVVNKAKGHRVAPSASPQQRDTEHRFW